MNLQFSDMGKRIRERRKELHIKQAEMAEAIGICNNHMSSIETGRQKPSIDIFVAICEYLRTSPDYLLLGTLHGYNIPQNILDKLKLCSPADIELAEKFIDLLVARNEHGNISEGYLQQ